MYVSAIIRIRLFLIVYVTSGVPQMPPGRALRNLLASATAL